MDSSVQGELSRAAKSGAAWRDGRRILAIKMHERGCSREAIAELLEVSQASVSWWLHHEEGLAGLARRPGSGSRPRLTLEPQAELRAHLQGGAQAAGFEGDIWTCQRVAQVYRARVGRALPPLSREPAAAPAWLEPAEACIACDAAGGAGH